MELKKNLRDQVTFERNTVWLDMVAMERRSAAAHVQAPAEVSSCGSGRGRAADGWPDVKVLGWGW